MKDGLLTITLVREIPEEMKPKTIRIGTGTEQARLTDQQQSGAANRNQDEKAAA